jgi:hypothetical protein
MFIVLGAVLVALFVVPAMKTIKKFLLKLTGSQKLLNVAMITCCAAVAVYGATHNAWEASFDSISSYVGMAPPTIKFNNVAFLDEFAAAFATLLFWLWMYGIIEFYSWRLSTAIRRWCSRSGFRRSTTRSEQAWWHG